VRLVCKVRAEKRAVEQLSEGSTTKGPLPKDLQMNRVPRFS